MERSLSSLPYDVALNCLARVPINHDPILSCVSKRLHSLVLSPQLSKTRSLMGVKDYPLLYVFFPSSTRNGWKFHWVTFNLKQKKTSRQKSVHVSTTLKNVHGCPIVSIGSKIYLVGGSDLNYGSSGLLIFDSRSRELCTGPSMKVARSGAGVAVVNGKIYVMGGCSSKEKIQVEVFDPKSQTWEVGPLGPHGKIQYGEGFGQAMFREAVAVDGKVYGMSYIDHDYHTIYDTKDGRCEAFEVSNAMTQKISGACVIESVIYVYYHKLGLMWYDSKEKIWRRVKGLNHDHEGFHKGMVDCNGKLACLWQDFEREKKIWCAMIVLDKVGEEIHGRVEWRKFVGFVPAYCIWSCLGLPF